MRAKKAELVGADAMVFAQPPIACGEHVLSLGPLADLISMWLAKSAASQGATL